MNSINGALRPTEEFAIDWIRVDAQGRLFHGVPNDVKNWFGYGADILAAGAGTVVEVMRDLPNEPPGASPTNLSLAQVG
jgi:ribose 1,5-bisphosphokinase PhnN